MQGSLLGTLLFSKGCLGIAQDDVEWTSQSNLRHSFYLGDRGKETGKWEAVAMQVASRGA